MVSSTSAEFVEEAPVEEAPVEAPFASAAVGVAVAPRVSPGEVAVAAMATVNELHEHFRPLIAAGEATREERDALIAEVHADFAAALGAQRARS